MTHAPNSTVNLTVIIPVRWSPDRTDIDERLAYVLHDDQRPAGVHILVIDDGSPHHLAARLQSACAELGFGYHRIDSETSTFSIGRARNVGTQVARTRFVMFQDADLLPYPGFYREVTNEIVVQGMDRFSERFLMFGVIYLTREASKEYADTPPELRRSQFIQHLLDADATRIEKFSTGTSVTVWSRDYFLGAGGNDPDFEGWGYEDLEFMCRALRREKRFPLPDEFSLDYRNFQNITEYRGWKSIYRLYGDTTFQKGMVLFHAWHPVESTGAYVQAKDRNRKIFEAKLKAFADRQEEPEPLPMPERGHTLMFRSNPWVYNRWVAPSFGTITMVDEEFFTVESFAEFVRKRGITRVVFHNPYVNERMTDLYRWVKATGMEFLVCERGALPGSVFFDAEGFNGESTSYAPARWQRALTGSEDTAITAYVRDLKASTEALEDQPPRQGPRVLRKKLALSVSAKVLFVPLQRPSDTVIDHLCGPIESYDNFIALVRRLTHALPPDWTVVVKRHPLEVVSPALPGVILADSAHINDLIELSDAVLLINSGVGVTALAFDKPLLYAGQAFYGHEGLARQVVTHDDVLHAIEHFKPDPTTVRQFLHYLVFEFYSFARFTTQRVSWIDGALMTATRRIDYLSVRLPGLAPVQMQRRLTPGVSQASILFDRYRSPDGKVGSTPATRPATGRVAASAPKAGESAASPRPQDNDTTRATHKPMLLRKFKKLRSNPVMFLRDSQFSMLRSLGKSIKAH